MESLSLQIRGGHAVSGWFLRGCHGGGVVLLLHGVRSDRRQMVERARFLHAAGYSALLLDLPAHGESIGGRITFGVHEGKSVAAALAYLRTKVPDEHIGVIGVSLGAASVILSDAAARPEALVLESMYPTITEAVADRLRIRLGAAGAAVAPAVLWQLPLWTGVQAHELRPIDRLRTLRVPVLIMGGSDDFHTTAAETRRLYTAAQSPKQIWIVAGAGHVDLHRFAPLAYEARVLPFLDRHVRNLRTMQRVRPRNLVHDLQLPACRALEGRPSWSRASHNFVNLGTSAAQLLKEHP